VSRAAWDALFHQTHAVWTAQPDLTAFCPFPEDVSVQDVAPLPMPAARLFAADPGLECRVFNALRDAARAVEPFAHWRDTYAGTNIARDFRDRFGCFTLIGDGGPFASETARAWFVYMPPRLYYPWHHHKADEIYLILGGSAVFRRAGQADVTLSEGATLFHAPFEPHAMETLEAPVMALVLWRADFEHRPVLTHADAS
jgi:quercetin dioxygenase-like cupin family protein